VIRDVPPAVSHIVSRCLAKSPADRYATAADVLSALDSVLRARKLPPPPGVRAILGRPVVKVTALLVILAMAAGGWRWRAATSRARWARTVAAPEIQRLTNHGDYVEAFLLARQALDALPDDRQLYQLWLDASIPAVVTSDPAGADVALASYHSRARAGFPRPDATQRRSDSSQSLPSSDFQGRFSDHRRLRTPAGTALWAGSVERGATGHGARGRRPRSRSNGPGRPADDYWLDRFEVTNRQFKEFVDQGGYGQREYWREPFVEADGPYRGKRPSGDFTTPADGRARRPGSLERTAPGRPSFRSEV
jgi:formylglycine-generating enzyme required for sulfatase activity